MTKRAFISMMGASGMILGAPQASMAQASMPKPVQDHIVSLSEAPGAAGSCVITSLLPAYYGTVSGGIGKLAVGMLDQDSENCGGMAPPQTHVVAYLISGTKYRQVALPARLGTLPVQKILGLSPETGGFKITVLFHGPHDPMCCATDKASFSVSIDR